ncbi:hypothetical protein QU42_20625 [Bradyrhizobium sp. UASWS1016]|nr:hypothetical protein QU42_20625 [Bradyrhizobium sp. UASWS1016]
MSDILTLPAALMAITRCLSSDMASRFSCCDRACMLERLFEGMARQLSLMSLRYWCDLPATRFGQIRNSQQLQPAIKPGRMLIG